MPKSIAIIHEKPYGTRKVVCPTFWDRPLFAMLKNCVTNQKKGDFRNSETKYFINFLQTLESVLEYNSETNCFINCLLYKKLIRGYYEKKR